MPTQCECAMGTLPNQKNEVEGLAPELMVPQKAVLIMGSETLKSLFTHELGNLTCAVLHKV